jgi:single-strand DNA-binding protein
MASGVNKVILIGNLGRDPEITTFENGVKKATFTLATTESYKNREGQRVDQTEWHNIVLWRGLAEVAHNYLTKGSQVFIEGRIRTRSYDDKDGNKRYITEILADNMTMLGGRRDSNAEYAANTTGAVAQEAPELGPSNEEDDLPF